MEFEQNKFILEAYFRNSIDNDGVWAYSVEPCLDQFRIRFRDLLTIPRPPGGTAILPEYIHYYGYYYQVIVQCLST
jgi:hypothetical protein